MKNRNPTIMAACVMLQLLGATGEPSAQVAADLGSSPITPARSRDVVPQPGQKIFIQDFSDPLENWVKDWFYLNTNAENFYVAEGGDCDPNFRGNQPAGIWISDDRGCGGLAAQNPVTIRFSNGFGDHAVLFSLDQFTCVNGVTFNLYDKDRKLVVSEPMPATCFDFSTYSYELTNGISAFEYSYTGDQEAVDPRSAEGEGNISIDNVKIRFHSRGSAKRP